MAPSGICRHLSPSAGWDPAPQAGASTSAKANAEMRLQTGKARVTLKSGSDRIRPSHSRSGTRPARGEPPFSAGWSVDPRSMRRAKDRTRTATIACGYIIRFLSNNITHLRQFSEPTRSFTHSSDSKQGDFSFVSIGGIMGDTPNLALRPTTISGRLVSRSGKAMERVELPLRDRGPPHLVGLGVILAGGPAYAPAGEINHQLRVMSLFSVGRASVGVA